MEAQQATLSRLLTRLDQTLLSRSSTLEKSPYERNKVSHNLEYARTLLLTLEKQSTNVKIQSQKTSIQADLQRKRETIKKLNARLLELNQAGDDDSSEEDEDVSGEGEDVLMEYAPAVREVQGGIDTGGTEPLDEATKSELRSRRPLQASDNREAASTTAREQLFAGREQTNTAQDPSLQKTETLLSHNRTEQDALSSGLLSLAQALKASSINFSQSLETEKDVLKRAELGLDKSSQGMDATEQRMGTLRRMTEGQGWWGRIKLYGMIGGLWLACFLLVFVVPKLRF